MRSGSTARSSSGRCTKPSLATIKDLDYREIITLGPLVVLTILFGVYPKPMLDLSAASVTQLLEQLREGDRRRESRRLAGALRHMNATPMNGFGPRR